MRDETITPFEEAGFSRQDVFVHKHRRRAYVLYRDDGSHAPMFRDVHSGNILFMRLDELRRAVKGEPEPTEFPAGSLFRNYYGDVYALMQTARNQFQLFNIVTGNRFQDEPLQGPVTVFDLPDDLEHLPRHGLEVYPLGEE